MSVGGTSVDFDLPLMLSRELTIALPFGGMRTTHQGELIPRLDLALLREQFEECGEPSR